MSKGEKIVSIAENKFNKTQSEAFNSIRDIVQAHMKANKVDYDDVLKSIEDDNKGVNDK